MQIKKSTWLLLLYELPAKRNSARVSLWRKLKLYGAIQLKTSAYVLPDTPAHYERFQWLATQIQDAGGEATLIRAAQIEGLADREIIQMFNDARAAEFQQLVADCRKSIAEYRKERATALGAELERHRRRFNEIQQLDFFQSPAAYDAQLMLQKAEKLLAPRRAPRRGETLRAVNFAGKNWLTRPRPGIDRCGSAWLIRRFIDTKARFVFGMDPAQHPGAIPFDMAEVEFSHHRDDCTFETLVKRFGLTDKAVHRIGQMVHDADLEDSKFGRPECLGINCVLGGWAKDGIQDDELLAKGMDCFEGLYRQLQK